MKKFVFSLLTIIICSTVTAQDENQFKEVQYNPETGKLAWAKEFIIDGAKGSIKSTCKEFKWNRESENDYHIQTPYIETPWFNIKKLEVNVSQLTHIVGAALSIKSLDFKREDGLASKKPFIYPSNLNRYNITAFLICTYRFFAGQEKIPFKIVEQEKATA